MIRGNMLSPALIGFVVVVLCGCSLGCRNDKQPTTRPASVRDRQDAAMRDPFGYTQDESFPDVSGGGIGDYDKEGMNRDVNRVLSP